jgi:hypothetical protein
LATNGERKEVDGNKPGKEKVVTHGDFA